MKHEEYILDTNNYAILLVRYEEYILDFSIYIILLQEEYILG